MIRRTDGDDWLLISQLEHARVAGEIAAVWGNSSVASLPRPDWLVPVVRDHDEGWRAWEQAPQVDPNTGRPRDFTEMPMVDATAIWEKSISFCSQVPLGRLWVSRHFCHLAEQARESRSDDPAEVAAIDTFLNQQQCVAEEESRRVAPSIGQNEFHRLADVGLRYLQFFDWLSLWLCCATRDVPEQFSKPDSGEIQLTPVTDKLFRVTPFPLAIDPLEIAVSARRVPARTFPDNAALHEILSTAPTEQLRWTIAR